MNIEEININTNENLLNLLNDNFLKNKLHQSNIFYGNKGIGKSLFTLKLANDIFLSFKSNNLKHKNLIEKNSHPNLKVISKIRDEKTKKLIKYISIDQIRNLQSFISHSSIYDLPKIIIIDSIIYFFFI